MTHHQRYYPKHAKTIRELSAERRARNHANGDCINETLAGTHGKATHGVRCQRCAAVHKFGAVVVQERGLDVLMPATTEQAA